MEEEEKRLCVCGGRREIMEEVQKERKKKYISRDSLTCTQTISAGWETDTEGRWARTTTPSQSFYAFILLQFSFYKIFFYSLSKIVGIFSTFFFLSSFIVMKEIVRSRVFSV